MLGTGEQTQYSHLQDIARAKEPYEKLWNTAVKFYAYYEKWMNGPLLEVNADEVEEEVFHFNIVICLFFLLCFLNFV